MKMPKLNMDAINKAQEEAVSKGSDKLYFSQSQIKVGSEVYMRILPPFDEKQNGIYFVKEVGFWVGRTRLVSLETFNEDCPAMEFVAEMKRLSKTDSEVKALYDAKNFSIKPIWYIPVLHMIPQYEDDESPVVDGYTVKDDCIKILQCGPQLFKKINTIATTKKYFTKNGLNLTDPTKGRAVILSKQGEGQDTEYGAMPDDAFELPDELVEKFYKTEDFPDIVGSIRDKMMPAEYNLAYLKHYFEGAEKPKAEDYKKPEAEAKKKGKKKASVKAPKKKAKSIKEQMESEEE